MLISLVTAFSKRDEPAHVERMNTDVQSALTALQQGRISDAERLGEQATRNDPGNPKSWTALGIVRARQARHEEAVVAFQTAVSIDPRNPSTHFNLAVALCKVGRTADALVELDLTLLRKPDLVVAHIQRGAVLRQLGRGEDAVRAFDAVLAIDPKHAEALSLRGMVLEEMGEWPASSASYERAAILRSDKVGWAIRSALSLPVIPESTDQIDLLRDRMADAIGRITESGGIIEDPLADVHRSFFRLAYHGRDDRPILEASARMYRRLCPILNYVSPHLERRKPAGGRIHIGFLSEHLFGHTVGILNKGLISGLDRRRFHVTVIHTDTTPRDWLRTEIDRHADAVVEIPRRDLPAAQRIVADLRLDILHYPDIGMSPFTYLLAFARLAAVQTVGWGHPDTTGLDTIDYFLSPGTAETDGAEACYTEKLIRFFRLPSWYEPPIAPGDIATRADFGMREEVRLYGCPQSLFKFHPDFDKVLTEIVDRDPAAQIVMVEGTWPNWRHHLEARWSRAAPVLLKRAVWLPRLSMDRFLMLLSHMDVMLDPVHFGSGNTLYEALSFGIPYITWPGAFMRGRLVAAAYHQLGVDDAPIVQMIGDYARVAVAFDTDPDRRTIHRQSVMNRAAALYRDDTAMREFETFVVATVADS